MLKNKLLLLVVLIPLLMLAVCPPASARSSKTVTLTLTTQNGFSSGEIPIPKGYTPGSAKLTFVMSGQEGNHLKIVIGKQSTAMTWPVDKIVTIDLSKEMWPATDIVVPVAASGSPGVPFLLNIEVTCLSSDQS